MYLEIKQTNPVCFWLLGSVTRKRNNVSQPTHLGAKFTHKARHEQDAMLNQALILFWYLLQGPILAEV